MSEKASLITPPTALELWTDFVCGLLMPGDVQTLLGEELWLVDGLYNGKDLHPGSMVFAIRVDIKEFESWLRFHRPDLVEIFEAAIAVAKATSSREKPWGC